jgi:hypothetical protein
METAPSMCFGATHCARSRNFAAALPAQLKPTTSNQFVQAVHVSTWPTARALANLFTLGRPPQKTPISRDGKNGGREKKW